MPTDPSGGSSRRSFLQHSTALGAGALLAGHSAVGHGAFAPDAEKTYRVGLVGCGGRGTGAARQTLVADKRVELVALADAFEDAVANSHSALLRTEVADRVKVDPEMMFHGLDAYQKLIDSGVDLVLLATPPHFRPQHLRACIEAGKHVFAEKPVAVDPVGVRHVLESTEMAKEKGLAIVSGLCWRYEPGMQETVSRLQDGAIGDLVYLQSVRYNQGVEKRQERQPEWTDMYHQVRNWYYYTWLSGDFNVEQFVHELDKMAWLMDDYPVTCLSTGGRETRTDPSYGNVFDHFATTYEFASGVRYYATTRQQRSCANEFSCHVFGTSGSSETMRFEIKNRSGETTWRHREKRGDMHQLEHNAMYAALRAGEIPNNGEYMAKSTLMGIMARMSAYTGKEVTWEQAISSKLDLSPAAYTWDAAPPPAEIAVPGVTPLV
jgi:myo-inositol 2-dehydrogenase / D-chiro-inositol 1-dehydrogenase